MKLRDTEFGNIEVTTLPLPGQVTEAHHPMYTCTGTVLLAYKTAEDPEGEHYYHIGVMEDDGGGLRDLYAGEIPLKKTGNGLRLMPCPDGKRVLLGDFVLECAPDMDHCQSAELVPVAYPDYLFQAPGLFMHWSEIVIAPDNTHMAWTALVGEGAVNFMGRMERGTDRYTLEEVRTISTASGVEPDPENPGYYRAVPMVGGEIKQFIHGGAALSLAGTAGAPLPDSVEQDLKTGKTSAVTRVPGYDETTIFSPDERLGITMSTRGSAKTSFAILGLVPRPYGILVTTAIINCIYMYAVAGARFFRRANVGPVLVDIAKSRAQAGYPGLQLNDPEEQWVYYSPMSWHPGGKKAMWPEWTRGAGQGRIRIVHLPDYAPGPAVAPVPVPRPQAYGADPRAALNAPLGADLDGSFKGRHGGRVDFSMRQADRAAGTGAFRETVYRQYSDDGVSFYDGTERVQVLPGQGVVYRADLTLAGERPGRMDLRLEFTEFSYAAPPALRFGAGEDGLPKTRGYAEYGGVRLTAEALREDG